MLHYVGSKQEIAVRLGLHNCLQKNTSIILLLSSLDIFSHMCTALSYLKNIQFHAT